MEVVYVDVMRLFCNIRNRENKTVPQIKSVSSHYCTIIGSKEIGSLLCNITISFSLGAMGKDRSCLLPKVLNYWVFLYLCWLPNKTYPCYLKVRVLKKQLAHVVVFL